MSSKPDFPFIAMLGNATPVGLLFDFRPHTPLDRLTTERAVEADEQKVKASMGRWWALLWALGIIAWQVFAQQGALAPLVVLVYLFLVNRLVWSNGRNPSLRGTADYASGFGWLMLAAATAAPALFGLGLLFPAPWWNAASNAAALVAVVAGLVDAFITAGRIRASQDPKAVDMRDAVLVAGILKMTSAAFDRGIADGSFEVARDAFGNIVARIPQGADALLEDRAALEARIAVKAPGWEVGDADPVENILTLAPAEAETVTARDAQRRSGGLFQEQVGTGVEGLEDLDLDIDWDAELTGDMPRLS